MQAGAGQQQARGRCWQGATQPPAHPLLQVYSDMLEWLPGGSDLEETGTQFVSSQLDVLQAVPVHKGILLAKLRPGQEIDLECHCVKGGPLLAAGAGVAHAPA